MTDITEGRGKEYVVRRVRHCIVNGDFVLHSGERSTWICDLLLTASTFWHFYNELNPKGMPLGLEFGGALLVAAGGADFGIIRKDGYIYFPETRELEASIVDDVCTTGKSFQGAEAKLIAHGYKVVEKVCVLDRRDARDRMGYPVRSLVTWEDVMKSRL